MSKPAIDIIRFVTDPDLLGLSLSAPQETLLRAIYGLPLSEEQLALWRECTGRAEYPGKRFLEVTVIAGARAGKDSRVAVPIALYEALFGNHEAELGRGETATIPIVAQDLRGCRTAFGYMLGYLRGSKLLQSQVAKETASEIVLKNGLTVACFACSGAATRGYSIPVGVLDELAFWRTEGHVTSDVEIQSSIRRGGLSFPQPLLVKISTPYMRSGVLHDDFERHFGKDSPCLVWRASSKLMNPSIRESRLEEERLKDPARYAREYEAEFAEDVQAAYDPFAIADFIVPGRTGLEPQPKHEIYSAFIDCSGGASKDSMALAIAHRDRWQEDAPVVIDCLKEWCPPYKVQGAVAEAAGILRRYNCWDVMGDRFGGQYPHEAFDRHKIDYHTAKKDKSQYYLELGSILNARKVELPDVPVLRKQLTALERRPGFAGKDRIDHPRSGHDDLANVVAGITAELYFSRPCRVIPYTA